ncbi:MAG: prepilin peptidase [Actinomycetales bacterium]
MVFRLASFWPERPWAFWLLLAALAYFVWMAVRLGRIDIRSHLLPNRIIFPSYAVAGTLLAAAALAAGEPAGVVRTLTGGAALWAGYLALRLAYPPGMGAGDVKLAGVLGMYLGWLNWESLLWATFAAFLMGGLWGVLLIASRRGSGQTRIPFGPFMLAGTLATLLGTAG